MEANLFGTPKRDTNWPEWINYTRFAKPKQVANIMNNSNVFLCTSRFEGFGLTGLESLFCGCSFVTTDCGGVREYASEKNATICKIDDVEGLTEGVCKEYEHLYEKDNKSLYNTFSLTSATKKFAKLVQN